MDQEFNKQEELQNTVEDHKLPSTFSKRLSELIEIIKNRPLVTLACIGHRQVKRDVNLSIERLKGMIYRIVVTIYQ
ncbi:MAG: hypothetical protein RCO49_08695 [Rickettsia endosymbiont of Argas persicus]